MYDLHIRQIAIRLYAQFHSLRKVACLLNTSHSTISRWINNPIQSTRKKKISKLNKPWILDFLKAYLLSHPFATIVDIRNILLNNFGITASIELVRLVIKKHIGFTRKRARRFSQPKNLDAQIDSFITQRDQYLALGYVMVSIDETSFGRNCLPAIGYAPKGQRLRIVNVRPRMTNTSVLAIAIPNKSIIWKSKEGAYDTLSFVAFLQTLNLPVNTVLLLDNVRFHHSTSVHDLANSKGWKLLYTPPYSPQFNPIEGIFSIVKRHYHRFQSIQDAFDSVTHHHITQFFNGSLK